MNAPENITATLEHLPLDNLRVSPLHLQGLRRARFDAESLLQLAANIKAIGIQQPIVVRPVPVKGTVRFEIVCGERRYLAADRAGLGHVPAVVRALSDEQSLEIQLSENIERESLHPLEEGQGFRELMDMKRISPEAVGALFGKSRAYVYTRTKLLDLCAPARDALQKGELDTSKALLLARIHGDKLQKKALDYMLGRGAHYSFRSMFSDLRRDFMIDLATAPFAQDDMTLTAKDKTVLPACATCPHRSGNDAELLDELKGDADVCTERACFDLKSAAYFRRQRADAQAAGIKILPAGDAANLIAGQYGGGIKSGHITLDAESMLPFPEPQPTQNKGESDDDFEKRENAWYDRQDEWHAPTYRQLLGDAIPATTVLAEAKGGKLVELLPIDSAVRKALKAKGITIGQQDLGLPEADETPADVEKQRAELLREQERRNVELEYRRRLLHAIHSKWKGPLKRDDLEQIAVKLFDEYGIGDALEEIYPNGGNSFAKASEADIQRAIAVYFLADDCESAHGKPGRLLEAAQRLKIDPKKIRTAVVQDLKPTSAPAADDGKKPAKKKATKK